MSDDDNDTNNAHIRFTIGTAATGGAFSIVLPPPKTVEEWSDFDKHIENLETRHRVLATKFAAMKVR